MERASADDATDVPWLQRLFDSIWVLALAAILYWVLSYVVWGIVDILSVSGG